MDLIANQNQNTGVVSAYSKATLAPDLGTMVLNSQANGNNVAVSGDGASGLISQVINQNNASQISSITETSMCCNNLISSQNALAVGNSSASSTYSASAYQWVSQNNNGEVKSSSDTMTVSYTHLDVYKRQAVRSVIERAVVEMMSNIYGVPGASVCRNAFGPNGDPMGPIGTTGAFIPRTEATLSLIHI